MTSARRATFALTVDGIDYAETIVPRLSTLTLTEKLGGEADRLEVVLTNHDGKLAPIKRLVDASLSLGWASGEGVKLGLIDKGRFKVDEVERSGPPDSVRILARSADLTGGYRKRKDRSWKNTTLGAVVREIAGDSGYGASVHPDLAAIALPSIEQAAKSDAAFIRDLGARYDAVATVKDKVLVFLPIGAQANAGGTAFPTLTLKRGDCGFSRFVVADREAHDGAEAKWHDRHAAKKKTARAGGSANPKRIKRTFASEGEAKAAADAEARKAERGEFEFEVDLSVGDPGIEPNNRLTLSGWDSEIDGVAWLVGEVTHTLDGRGGLTGKLKLVSLKGSHLSNSNSQPGLE